MRRLAALALVWGLLTAPVQGYTAVYAWQNSPPSGPPYTVQVDVGAVPVDVNPCCTPYLTPAQVVYWTQWAIDRWNEVGTPLRFYIRDAASNRTSNDYLCACVLVYADVTMDPLLHGTVSRGYAPGVRYAAISHALLRMNGTHRWKTDPNDPLPWAIDYPAVLLHEFGHVVGLNHSTAEGAVMWTPRRDLQPDDIAGMRELYPGVRPVGPVTPTRVAVGGA
jgi:hypothetical protein